MSVLQALENKNHEETYASEIQRMILAQAAWMVVLFGSLQYFGVFSVEQFYVLSYVGFVVLVGLFAPTEPTPRWWRGVQLLVFLGFIGLCYFVFERVADVVAI